MTKRTTSQNRSASRLLRQLGEVGATARLCEDSVVVSSLNGATTISLPRAAADQLVAKKLVTQTKDGILLLTEVGRATAARKPSDNPLPHRNEDFTPDEFRAQHASMSKQRRGEGDAVVYCNDAESPLLWMRRRKGADGEPMIGAAAFAAGERLRQDYSMSRTAPRMSVDWSNPLAGSKNSGSAGMNATESMIAAGQRMNAALHAVGPEFSGLLFDLCCFLKGLEQIERERRWPVRSAKVVVGLALERLARHYGFSDETRGREPNGRIRAWSATAAKAPTTS